MNETFDPYHKWLGIPPAQQPPSHYRLLGLEVFESDRDVIDTAANQRAAYLQDVAGGNRIAESQKLLNEVAAARRCLLDPVRKSEYDAALRAQLATKLPVPAAEFAGLEVEPVVPSKPPAVRPRAASSARLLILMGVAISMLVLTVGAGVLALVMTRNEVPANTSTSMARATTPTAPRTAGFIPAVPKPTPTSAAVAKPTAAVKPTQAPKPMPTKPVPPPPPTPPVRPMVHFVPSNRVLAEPCELVKIGQMYHLFYVHYAANAPARRIWGHASSPDLMTWTENPPPFAPAPNTSAEVGSVVIDAGNSSGLGTTTKPPIVAIYGSVGNKQTGAKSDSSTVDLAFSVDDGKTWKNYEKNPVLKLKPGQRHPRVLWHAPTKNWVMLVFLGPTKPKSKDGRIAIYHASNLRDWKAGSEFDFPGGHECPELCELAVDKDAAKWWLLSRNGRFHPVVFDGQKIALDPKGFGVLDRGPNAVAPRVSVMPDGRRLLTCLVNADPASRSFLTLPVEFRALKHSNGAFAFRRDWPRELAPWRDEKLKLADLDLKAKSDPLERAPAADAYELDVSLEAADDNAAADFFLHGTSLRLTAKDNKIVTGSLNATAGFWMKRLHVRVIVDRTSIELMTGPGQQTLLLPLPANAVVSRPKLTGQGFRILSLRYAVLKAPAASKPAP